MQPKELPDADERALVMVSAAQRAFAIGKQKAFVLRCERAKGMS